MEGQGGHMEAGAGEGAAPDSTAILQVTQPLVGGSDGVHMHMVGLGAVLALHVLCPTLLSRRSRTGCGPGA